MAKKKEELAEDSQAAQTGDAADEGQLYEITVPYSRFEGERGGVKFRGGRGETRDVDRARELAGLGYIVTPEPAAKPKAKKDEVA